MDRQYIDQNHIVDRYVGGLLSADETDRFEQYYFEHPEVLDEIALARSLRQGLQANVDLLRAEPAPTLLDRLRGWLMTPAWALAAPVAAFAAGAVLLAPMLGPRGAIELAGQSVTAEVYLIRTRGTTTPTPVSAYRQAGLLLLAVDVAGLEPDGLLGELRQSDNSEPLMTLSLTADDEGLAQTVVPADRLAPGNYEFRAVDRTGAALTYRFDIADDVGS